MENHPIPQDITGFQFKLIGEMTVKQFSYLAGGVVFGWFMAFVMPLPFLIKWPIALFSGGLGAALAFMPIEGRPLDQMIMTFFTTLVKPSQYIYRKDEQQFNMLYQTATQAAPKKNAKTQHLAPHYTEADLESYLQTTHHDGKSNLDKRETVFFNNIVALSQGKTPQAVPQTTPVTQPVLQQAPKAAPPVSQQQPETKEVLEQQETGLKQALAEAQKEESTGASTQAHQKVVSLEAELAEVEKSRRDLEAQLISLQKKLNQAAPNSPQAPQAERAQPEAASIVTVPKTMSKAVGLPLVPDAPNVLVGIIKDARNNPLPNILVEVIDKDGNPVRAFKTNQLGQFASATSLTNGTYTLSFEDGAGKHRFDKVQITATGEVLMPLEVHSVDDREELRRWLFNGQQTGQ